MQKNGCFHNKNTKLFCCTLVYKNNNPVKGGSSLKKFLPLLILTFFLTAAASLCLPSFLSIGQECWEARAAVHPYRVYDTNSQRIEKLLQNKNAVVPVHQLQIHLSSRFLHRLEPDNTSKEKLELLHENLMKAK